MIIIAIVSKKYKYSIINSIILMIIMNSTYYIIRLIKSSYTNWGNWDMYNFVSIGGTLFISTLVFVVKDIIFKKKNKFRIFNLILMLIFGIVFTIFGINLWFKFYNLMQYTALGIIIAYALALLINNIYIKFNNKKEMFL